MLKQRVITALVLVALVLIALFAAHPGYWRVLINVAVLVAFWEWTRFCKISQPIPLTASFALFVAVSYFLQAGHLSLLVVVAVACVVWIAMLIFTLTDKLDQLHHPAAKLLVGIFILATASWLVIEFKTLKDGPLWILFFFLAVWAADIGAYFVGRKFGKTKLAPTVSPGKTVEGLLGGLAFVLLISIPALLYIFPPQKALLLVFTALITALVSVGGDLFESKMKRFAGLKDSSQILPGHGGVLDRIDSLLAGAPFFSLGLISLGYLAQQ